MFALIASNLGIAIAYFAIPIALYHFIRKRRDVPYPWMFRLFAMFIVACGLTHLMQIWTLYQPVYWLESCIDAYTALISLLTAALLWPLIPKALALRSPAELEQANAQLARVNSELQIARDKALESSNLKSAFVANISHELRTPLSGIIGMTELLLATRMTEEQQELADATFESAQSLLAIVNDILDLSKIEAGKMELESIELNPSSLLTESIQVIANSAKKKHLRLTTDIDGNLPEKVYGDSVRIEQVLINLLSNAVKFTDEGGIAASAYLESSDKEFATVKYSVTDTGIGISASEAQYLFLPFSQADTSTTRKYGGTGLGLAIGKRLVELMGGKIGFISNKGRGSIFWFTIPYRLEPREPIHRIKQVVSPPQTVLASKTVLVIEDNVVLSALAQKQLEKLGAKPLCVATAQEAWDTLNNQPVDLVLMDCHLPNIDGFEATRKIREDEKKTGSHIPIVALTAGAMIGDPEKCLESGMDDYLSKPYTIAQLEEKLKLWLSN